jgi:hypothetical protein
METKNHSTMEVTKNGKTMILMIPSGTTYGEAYDALFDMTAEIIKGMSKRADDTATMIKEKTVDV